MECCARVSSRSWGETRHKERLRRRLRPKSRQFNLLFSRRFFISCLYSRLCRNLRDAGAICLQDSASPRQIVTFPWRNVDLRRRQEPVNSNKTGTITRPPSLKPNWRPPWRPKAEITPSKELQFFYTKQLYLNKNKGLKQTTILELYSKTSFVNVERFKPYFFASWRAKFSSARSNLLNINSNMKLQITQTFLQLVDAEYLELSRKPSLNLWNWNLGTKNLIFAKQQTLLGNWTLPSSFLKVGAQIFKFPVNFKIFKSRRKIV
jgi:hypothetical protein